MLRNQIAGVDLLKAQLGMLVNITSPRDDSWLHFGRPAVTQSKGLNARSAAIGSRSRPGPSSSLPGW